MGVVKIVTRLGQNLVLLIDVTSKKKSNWGTIPLRKRWLHGVYVVITSCNYHYVINCNYITRKKVVDKCPKTVQIVMTVPHQSLSIPKGPLRQVITGQRTQPGNERWRTHQNESSPLLSIERRGDSNRDTEVEWFINEVALRFRIVRSDQIVSIEWRQTRGRREGHRV